MYRARPGSAPVSRRSAAARRIAGGLLVLLVGGGLTACEPQAPPTITGVDPSNGKTGVCLTSSVTLATSETADTATIGPDSVRVLAPSGVQVDGNYNSDAAGGIISFTPAERLVRDTRYVVQTTSALQAFDNGEPFVNFSSAFTTGSCGVTPAGFQFESPTFANLTGPSSVTLGPDGRLYVATGVGQIYRYDLGPDGLAVGTPLLVKRWEYQRTILGLRFDPSSTATNLKLWVSHGVLGFEDVPDFTGKISVLTGANLENGRDVITGLPRSVHDHMNNGIDFGPDGNLYIAQGSHNAFGAPDEYWGFREEVPLSAAMLVADVNRDSRFAGTVDVDTSKGYSPTATGAPVRVHASGTRNPYDLVWHSNGRLYSAVNESAAGGNAPAGPNGSPPALTNLPAGRDFLARITVGKYYGHPNPSRGEYVLNGGNPTASQDTVFEQPQYPVGTMPDPDWQVPALDLGLHRSANGIAEYTSDAFGPSLKGRLLITEFSNGDDIIAVGLDASGNPTSLTQLASGLFNPLDLTVDRRNGNIYVAEYGSQPEGTGGKLTLLRPAAGTRTPVARVNFQPETSTVPGYYVKDYGQAYDAVGRKFGWVQQSSATPVSVVGNARDRNKLNDDHLDTFMHMQYDQVAQPAAGSVPVSARWQHVVANGTYDVTVSVGDATAIDSTHRLVIEGDVAIASFKPTNATRFEQVTVRVNVADGAITVDAAGGRNTKINFVDIDRVTLPTG